VGHCEANWIQKVFSVEMSEKNFFCWQRKHNLLSLQKNQQLDKMSATQEPVIQIGGEIGEEAGMEEVPVQVETDEVEEAEELSEIPKQENKLFDEHLQRVRDVMKQAYLRVRFEVEEELDNAKNFVSFVVKAMEALSEADLHGWEKKEIVMDVVHDVVNEMTISEEDKQVLRERSIPAIGTIIDVLVAASKGYLYLQHTTKHAVEDAKDSCAGCGCFPKRSKGKKALDTVKPRDDVSVGDKVDTAALVGTVYDQIRGMIKHKQVSVEMFISLGSIVMQIVEEFPSLQGWEKKNLVLAVIHKALEEIPPHALSDSARAAIKIAIDTTVSATIDFIIKASRGEVEFVNRIVDGCAARCC
jgi:hypothetical protein